VLGIVHGSLQLRVRGADHRGQLAPPGSAARRHRPIRPCCPPGRSSWSSGRVGRRSLLWSALAVSAWLTTIPETIVPIVPVAKVRISRVVLPPQRVIRNQHAIASLGGRLGKISVRVVGVSPHPARCARRPLSPGHFGSTAPASDPRGFAAPSPAARGEAIWPPGRPESYPRYGLASTFSTPTGAVSVV
jgi:hypothetical protein